MNRLLVLFIVFQTACVARALPFDRFRTVGEVPDVQTADPDHVRIVTIGDSALQDGQGADVLLRHQLHLRSR